MFGSAESVVRSLLEAAGVSIGGPHPQDIEVLDSRFYARVIRDTSLGLGESYMDGWWRANQLDEFVACLLRAGLNHKIALLPWSQLSQLLAIRLFNLQSLSRSFEVGQKHYDLGNDLYQRMLDPRLVYSCGYWPEAKSLEQAQEHKLDLICRKLGLQSGMTLLDIGCGWGSLLKYAAQKYGVEGVGLTVSEAQRDFAVADTQGLPVTVLLQDYRTFSGRFDRIASVGMFEHVGYKNYRTFMSAAERCLKPQGLFLLHTIGQNTTSFQPAPWIDKYIFPNGYLPSMAQIAQSAESLFVVEDWHNFGPDYDLTLLAWHRNFQQAWAELSGRYDPRFKRMWDYYLLSSAGSFRARNLQLWQLVLSRPGEIRDYRSVR